MLTCLYDTRGGRGCPAERTLDYDFCIDHLQTPRGRQHVSDVIAAGRVTLPSQVEAAIKEATKLPDEDYQTTAIERMMDALERVLDWEATAKRNLDALGGPEQWRFTDRAGTEQSRTELHVYERAMDRTARLLAQVSKSALAEKQISLGKGQTELMIKILLSIINKLSLDARTVETARRLLLEAFQEEANLTARVEHHVTKQLTVNGEVTTPTGVGVTIAGQKVI